MQQCSCISTQDENENLSSSLSCDQEECENKVKIKNKNKNKNSYIIKVKAEIYKYWAIEDYCPYGQQCAYAHGKHEIRQKTHVPHNYKTQICKNYTSIGQISRLNQFIVVMVKDANLNILKKKYQTSLYYLLKSTKQYGKHLFQTKVQGLFYIPRLIKNQQRSKGLPYKI